MLFRCFLMLLIAVTGITVDAGTDAIDTALENCNQVESILDVATACDIQIDCLFNTATINCSEPTLVQLIQGCDAFDLSLCVDIAVLTMIAIDDAILRFQTMDSTTQLNSSLRAFIDGDYQTAIDLYENITLALDYYPHHILELGLGIIYQQFDNPDVALIQFDKSLNLEFYNPIAFYYRGQTYEQRDNDIRALRDHYMYDLLADPSVKATLPLASFRIQIPDSQPWNWYPVYTMDIQPDSFTLSDDTLEPKQSIVVSMVDNNETLVIAEWLDIVAGNETEILFFERDPQNPLRYILNINQQDVPNSIPSGKTEVSIVLSPTHLDVYLRSSQNEHETLFTSLANAIAEPDIRTDSTLRLCDGAPLSLLNIDDKIVPLADSQLVLWDDPAVDDQITDIDFNSSDEDEKLFAVVDGAVCFDNQIWWQVSNGRLTGWIPENDSITSNFYGILSTELINLWATNPPSPHQFMGLVESRG